MEKIKKPHFDRLYALKVASLIQEHKSFTKVSNILGVSVSSITKEVQKLEEYFNTKIFQRTTRAIHTTEEGKILLQKSMILVQGLQALEQEVSGDIEVTKGQLHITAPVSIGEHFITKILCKFQAAHPYIDIKITLSDYILDPIKNDIDLSIRTAQTLSDSSLYAKKVGRVKRGIFASQKYLKHFKIPKRPQNLSDHNCLMYQRVNSEHEWTLKKGKSKPIALNLTGSFKSNNLNVLKNACLEGLGIANLPLYLLKKKDSPQRLFKTWDIPTQDIYLLTSAKPTSLRKIQTLVEFLTTEFRDNHSFN